MGYTNYYNSPIKKSERKWNAFIAAATAVLEHTFKVPQFTDSEVDDVSADIQDRYSEDSTIQSCTAFQIQADNLCILGPHEWLYLPKPGSPAFDESFQFCKTAGKMYDGLIKIIYLLAVVHLGGTFNFDGKMADCLEEALENSNPIDHRHVDRLIRELRGKVEVEGNRAMQKPKKKAAAPCPSS